LVPQTDVEMPLPLLIPVLPQTRLSCAGLDFICCV